MLSEIDVEKAPKEADRSVTVAFMVPEAVLQLVYKENIAEIGEEVRARLTRVRDSLAVDAR